MLNRDRFQIKTSFPLKPSLCGSGLESCPTGKLLDFLAWVDVLNCDRLTSERMSSKDDLPSRNGRGNVEDLGDGE